MLAKMYRNQIISIFLMGIHKRTISLQNSLTSFLPSFFPSFLLAISFKIKCSHACELIIALLGTYARKMKIYVHINTCTRMFLAATYIIP
jgi:hypothetical protein